MASLLLLLALVTVIVLVFITGVALTGSLGPGTDRTPRKKRKVLRKKHRSKLMRARVVRVEPWNQIERRAPKGAVAARRLPIAEAQKPSFPSRLDFGSGVRPLRTRSETTPLHFSHL